MHYFLTFSIGQGILLSILLINKSWRKKNHAWLIAIFILAISGVILGSVLNEWLGEPVGSLLADPLILLIGPSFYLYIVRFSRQLRLHDGIRHGAAFLLYLPVIAFFYYRLVLPHNGQVSVQAVYQSAFAVSIGALKFLHLSVYVLLSFGALREHSEKLERIFADLSGKDLAWLRYMLWAFVLLVAISLVLYFAALQHPILQNRLTLINIALLSAFILTIAFYAFHQNTIFDYTIKNGQAAELAVIAAETEGPRYEKSGLKPEEAERIKVQIEAFMQKGGFLDPDITLATLARETGVLPHKISEVLGKHLNTSFYDLINERRIEQIKKAIHDPSYANMSILGIAYEFGFNSKSSFNAAFKKFTGTTPSEYKRTNA